MSLREQVEEDLAQTLEDPVDWGLPIELIDPEGNIQTKSANDPTADLTGQILYDTIRVDPETGLQMIVHNPVVTLRRSSLNRVPVAGEKWGARFPETPNASAPQVLHTMEQAPEGGKSIGFVRLYFTRAENP